MEFMFKDEQKEGLTRQRDDEIQINSVVAGGTQVSLEGQKTRLNKRPRKMGGIDQSVADTDLKLRWNGLCWEYQS